MGCHLTSSSQSAGLIWLCSERCGIACWTVAQPRGPRGPLRRGKNGGGATVGRSRIRGKPLPPLVHASIDARTSCSAGGLEIAAIWRGIDSKGRTGLSQVFKKSVLIPRQEARFFSNTTPVPPPPPPPTRVDLGLDDGTDSGIKSGAPERPLCVWCLAQPRMTCPLRKFRLRNR